MNRYNSLKLFDYTIFTSNIDQINIESKCVINTLNQYSFIVAEQDKVFKSSLIDSDILLPDGIGIVAVTRLLEGEKIKKIAGADLHLHLLKTLNKNKGRCFYLGSSNKTLAEIKKRLSLDFPDIQAVFYSPPFKSVFSEEDNISILEKINSFKPDVLFVGMTAPKQEKWVYEHKDLLDAKIICSIGAVFDFYAGTVKRPGTFWINLGLEWLVRFLNEPKRMWKRYFYYGPAFIYLALREKAATYFRKRK